MTRHDEPAEGDVAGVAYAAASVCPSCKRMVRHKPQGGPHRWHGCRLRWVARRVARAKSRGWDAGYRFALENVSDPMVYADLTEYGSGWAGVVAAGWHHPQRRGGAMSGEGHEEAIARLRELLSKATPGAWKLWGMTVLADQDGTSNVDTAVPAAQTYHRDENDKPRTWDASFIAESHNLLPALLDERDALRAQVERVRALGDSWVGFDDSHHYGDAVLVAIGPDALDPQ